MVIDARKKKSQNEVEQHRKVLKSAISFLIFNLLNLMIVLLNFELSLFFLQSDSRGCPLCKYSENRWISRHENWKIVSICFRIRFRHFKLIIPLLWKLGSCRVKRTLFIYISLIFCHIHWAGYNTPFSAGKFWEVNRESLSGEIKDWQTLVVLNSIYLNEKYNSFLCCNMRRTVSV